MPKKRKTLPQNFDELIQAGKLSELKEVFYKCGLNAVGGYSKGTALGFFNIPSGLVRWLVSKGADINAVDIYGKTPLLQNLVRRSGNIDIFLELGADIQAADNDGDTALHMAAGSSFNPDSVRKLLKKGANLFAVNKDGEDALTYALKRANNADIEDLVVIADILIGAGITITPQMQKAVTNIGDNFEFHRDNFNEKSLAAADSALSHLYQKFNVSPVEKRQMHDGVSPINVGAGKWDEQYSRLWDLLIPSSGPAKTVQGEVIRITGRVRDEMFRNGGANWNSDYKKMLDALLVHFASQTPLSDALLKEAISIAKEVRKNGDGDDDLSRLCELAVIWVSANPKPVLLDKPAYDR